MKTVLAFVRKDSRALWWAIVPALLLYAALIWMDSRRHGSLPGMAEGWAYLIVPLAWGFLVGLAVLEDVPLQRRQFWMATPCRPGTLLGAKALFAICWVHVPYLIGCCLILAARGFAPWEDVPQLLWKQATVLAVVTLPAIAAASLVSGISQFLVVVVATVGLAPYALTNLVVTHRGPFEEDSTEVMILTVLLALGSMVVLATVFGFRRAAAARTLGVAAVAGVLVVATSWTMLDSLRLEDYFPAEPLPRVKFRIPSEPDLANLPEELRSNSLRLPGRTDVFLPTEFSGLRPEEINWDLDNLRMTLTAVGGERVEVAEPPKNGDLRTAGAWGIFATTGTSRSSLILCMNLPEALFHRLRQSKVVLEGHLRASGNLLAETQSMKMGVRQRVTGLGICEIEVVPAFNGTQFARELSVACASTRRIPPFSEAGYADYLKLGVRPKHLVDRSAMNNTWPYQTWLSPVYRAQAGWGTSAMGEERLSDQKFDLRPSRNERSELVRFRAEGLDLNRYALGFQPAEQH